MSATIVPTVLERLPELHGEKARRWLELAVQHAFTFCRDVHGYHEPADVDSVRIMAVSVWVTSKGKPSWDKLDVDHCIELARSIGCGHESIEAFTLNINAFVCFLNKFSLIDNGEAVRISDHVQPLLAPLFERFLASQQPAPSDEAMLN